VLCHLTRPWNRRIVCSGDGGEQAAFAAVVSRLGDDLPLVFSRDISAADIIIVTQD
jgi:hypothetical protein